MKTEKERIEALEQEIKILQENIHNINKYVYPKATLEKYLKDKKGNIFTRFILYILYYLSRFSMFFIEKFGFIMGNFVRKLLFFIFLLWLSFFGVTKYVQYQLDSYKESINQRVAQTIVNPGKKGIKKINETINKVILNPINDLLK